MKKKVANRAHLLLVSLPFGGRELSNWHLPGTVRVSDGIRMENDDGLPIRLVLLDNDDVARTRSVARLDQHAGLEIVGDAADSTDALRLTRELQPDAILVESHLQDKRGLEAIALLSSIDEAERPAVVACLEILHRGTWPQRGRREPTTCC